MSSATDDEKWIRRVVELAWQSGGWVEPDPMVGCVIVQDDKVIAEGWHLAFGGDHVEVDAIKNCTTDPIDATPYVTLEPYSRHEKTPPCTDAIISNRISRVVIERQDPSANGNGLGIEKLRTAGIHVEQELLTNSVNELIQPYMKRIQTGKPRVIAKWVMSLGA